MLVLRLRRAGTNRKAFYHVVATDSRHPRDGRCTEKLGFYNPRANPPIMKLEWDKVETWLKKGAQPSDTVRTLLKQARKGKTAAPVVSPTEQRALKRQEKAAAAAAAAAGTAPAAGA